MLRIAKALLVGSATILLFAASAMAEEIRLRCQLSNFCCNPMRWHIDLTRQTARLAMRGESWSDPHPVRASREGIWVYDHPGTRVMYTIDRGTGEFVWYISTGNKYGVCEPDQQRF